MSAKGDTIGLLELSSVAQGYLAADSMLKAATVELMLARSICSGKFLVAVGGDVASVNAAVAAGGAVAGSSVIEQGVIASLHPSVLPAIGQSTVPGPENRGALGILETFSAGSIIRAADAAAKVSDVRLLRVHLAMALGGKGLCLMTGDLADVEAAIVAGSRAAEGMLVNAALVPAPDRVLLAEYV